MLVKQIVVKGSMIGNKENAKRFRVFDKTAETNKYGYRFTFDFHLPIDRMNSDIEKMDKNL